MRNLIESENPPRLTGQWAAKRAARSRSRCDPPIMSGLYSELNCGLAKVRHNPVPEWYLTLVRYRFVGVSKVQAQRLGVFPSEELQRSPSEPQEF
jgi:hypothetical protein